MSNESEYVSRIEIYKNNNSINNISVILLPGAGQGCWNESHPTVKLCFQLGFPIVYSLLLPFHGRYKRETKFIHSKRHSIATLEVEKLYNLLAPIVKNKQVLYLGYSNGALLMIKLWSKLELLHSSNSLAILLATALKTTRDSLVQKYWIDFINTRVPIIVETHGDTKNYVKLTTETVMLDHELEGWQETGLIALDLAGRFDSALLLTDSEKQYLFNPKDKKPLYFITGDTDEPYPIGPSVIEVLQSLGWTKEEIQKQTKIITSGHFNLFKEKNWPQAAAAISQRLLTCNIPIKTDSNNVNSSVKQPDTQSKL